MVGLWPLPLSAPHAGAAHTQFGGSCAVWKLTRLWIVCVAIGFVAVAALALALGTLLDPG